MHLKLLVGLAVFLVCSSLRAQERNWSDDTGKFNVEAELLRVENDIAILKKTDGKELKVPLNRLSSKDRRFVKNWQADQDAEMDEKESGDTQDSSASAKGEDTASDDRNDDAKKTDWLADVKVKATAKREPGFDYDFNSNDPKPEIVASVDITGKAAAQAISYGKLVIESFTEGKNNELKMAEEKFGTDITKEMDKVSKRGDDFFANHPKDGVRVNIKSIDKTGKINKISGIKGTIDVLTGGKPKLVVLNDVAQYKTGDVDMPVLKELDIKCEFDRTGNQVTVKFNGDLSNLASLKFLDEKNKEVEPQGWSAGGGGGLWQYSYDFDKIPSANLVIEFRVGPETVTLPFEAKNITIKQD